MRVLNPEKDTPVFRSLREPGKKNRPDAARIYTGSPGFVNALITPAIHHCDRKTPVMDLYQRIAGKRDGILELAARFGIRDIRIFGSVARHEAGEGSDIDFLVEFPPGASLLTHAAFQRELSDLLGCSVDVASVHGLKNRIREAVLQEAVPL